MAFRHQLMEGARIKQLSSYYGFKNPCDFSAEFKRWYQVSPSIFVTDSRGRAKLDDDGSTHGEMNFGQKTIAFDLPCHEIPS